MIIGYARTSTTDQKAGLEAQLRDLKAAGCEKVFTEEVSSVDVVARVQLKAALEFAREGDVVVITKLDRLARSVAHLLQIVEDMESAGVSLRILDLAIDTATPTGRLMLTMIGGIAQFEREIMLERQREGIAKAKAAGKYLGRKPTARAKTKEIKALSAQGVKPMEIAKQLGIGKSSVYRILEEA
ncbi:Transposon Tn3 resolvase (plasmid) [Pseudoseohaeicola sp. NH-UV-7]|uniref:recombinase family protein n=1 Tax=Sulfitobacter sp. TBRI5 TaxID=2989732 RepID=UPI003A5F0F5D